jgi:hypothetical protein
MWRLKRLYERAIERVKGNWASSDTATESFSDTDHVYALDLNIFGERSLFELLCIARTSIGRRGLANYAAESTCVKESRCSASSILTSPNGTRSKTG